MRDTPPPPVRFSIIVPVYEHWHLVPGLLDRLKQQTFPSQRVQVILVDNGSKAFAPPSDLPGNVTVLRCGMPGSYAARNEGARHARGDWLVFTDADCRPRANWLSELDEAAASHGDGTLIAGAVEVVGASARPNVWEIYDMVRGIPQQRYVSRGYAATANLAVSRVVFDEMHGFDDKRFSGGDADFCRRAGAAGHPIVYAEAARVDHPARATWQEISTKARRVKGGQLTAGPLRRRRLWLLATIVPPIRDAWRFLRSPRHRLIHRMIAVVVLVRIWMTELAEAARLLLGRPAERR